MIQSISPFRQSDKIILLTQNQEDFLIGAFMRGNKPLVLPGEKEGFSKAKTGELKASPNSLDNI